MRLFSQIGVEQVVSLDAQKVAEQREAIATGGSEAAAHGAAQTKLPEGAQVVSSRTVREKREGAEEISANNEAEVRETLTGRISKDASIAEIRCIDPGRKGVLGIGRTKGRWKVRWIEPCEVAVRYTLPVEIALKFIPSS